MTPRPAFTIETTHLLLRARQGGDDGDMVEVAILLKSGLVEAGWLRFSLICAEDRDVELGFFLEPSQRGRGLMREAVRAAAPRALHLLQARSLCALLPEDSPPARKVAAALGLVAGKRKGELRRYEKDLCGLI